MDLSYVHIRYFIGYVYHICLQDTIQSTLSLCLLCQAMLLPMPLRPLLLTTRSGFRGIFIFIFIFRCRTVGIYSYDPSRREDSDADSMLESSEEESSES